MRLGSQVDKTEPDVVHYVMRSLLLPTLVVSLIASCGGDDSSSSDVDADVAVEVDASAANCFPLSGPSSDLPDAIPSTFTGESLTWNRPTGEECPAPTLGDTAVPFETVCYVNDTGASVDILFEVIAVDDIKPAAVIYDGDSIPNDPAQCAAVSSDLVIDVAEAYYSVPAGAIVTLVATLQDAETGDFQFVITPE
ncbi:MAG: hypothetical protein GY811_20195 [Myxococcales bacterium]|nr:hypothetical protein [Myxococcales bacterium]